MTPEPTLSDRNGDDDWQRWSKLVLHELDSLNHKYKEISEQLQRLHVDYKVFKSEMQIRAGWFGAAAGLVPSVIVALILYLKD